MQMPPIVNQEKIILRIVKLPTVHTPLTQLPYVSIENQYWAYKTIKEIITIQNEIFPNLVLGNNEIFLLIFIKKIKKRYINLSKRPHEELNPDLSDRNEIFYPLNYGSNTLTSN